MPKIPSQRKAKVSTSRPVLEALEQRRLLSSAAGALAVPDFYALPQTAEPLGGTAPPALSAKTIRNAYGVSSISFNGVTGDGAGQTIAIIGAYDNPGLVDSTAKNFDTSDLHEFDVAMGLADPPSFVKVNQSGGTTYPADPPATDPGWAFESDLDVEWAHAMAPDANIILVEAAQPTAADLIQGAVQYARGVKGVSVVSMSFSLYQSEGGEDPSETQYDSYFETPSGHTGITFVAATGDDITQGAYPAYSPNVLAVGATTLSLSNGNYSGETSNNISGGGISEYESKPAYQFGYGPSSTQRTIPDVSFDGALATGVSVYDSYDGQGTDPWYTGAGTSLSAPVWAGLIADADQGRALLKLGTLDGATQTLPRLYELNSSAFHDITVGHNSYNAGTGYDLVTGRGSPIANILVPDLAGGNSVSGTIFLDTNGNGVQNTGESGLSGWSTFVDIYDAGVKEGIDPQVSSSSTGLYQFTDLPGGTYRFTETTPSGYKRTVPTSYYTITIGYGSDITGKSIGYQKIVTAPATGSISGYVWDDANGDGKWDDSEKGVAGITVYLDINGDGKFDTGDISTTTNASGYFIFSNLVAGSYRIREVLPSGKKQTAPTSGVYSDTIAAGQSIQNKYFGNQ